MCQADAFAGAGLRAGTPEQFEDALVVGVGDAAPIVLDFDDNTIARDMARLDGDPQGPVRLLILDGIVEHVAQDLLERQAVGDELADANIGGDLALALADLVMHRRGAGLGDL
ncbi:hypothetical protein D3C87_1778840 [compost metagenome]